MDDEEWFQLSKMHEQINESGISAFDSAYLERYAELFAKSLQGKGDALPTPTQDVSVRPNHSMV